MWYALLKVPLEEFPVSFLCLSRAILYKRAVKETFGAANMHRGGCETHRTFIANLNWSRDVGKVAHCSHHTYIVASPSFLIISFNFNFIFFLHPRLFFLLLLNLRFLIKHQEVH